MEESPLTDTQKFRAMYAKVYKPSNSNVPYLVAVISALFLTVAGSAFIIFLRPDYDPIIIIAGIGTATGAVTTQILQFIKLNDVAKTAEIAAIQSRETKIQTDATHTMMNSKLTEAIAEAKKAGFDAGLLAGESKANARTDELAAARVEEAKPK